MSIHVFDLDETIFFHDDMRLNHEIIPILRELAKKRDSKKDVVAIFLLTNNGDDAFVHLIVDVLNDEIYGSNSKKFLFDYILTRNHPNRNGPSSNPSKSMNDIIYMMNQINIPFSYDYKIFFYDDLKGHILESEIPKDNYIQVKPYNTDFTPVINSLNLKQSGGSSKYSGPKVKKVRLKPSALAPRECSPLTLRRESYKYQQSHLKKSIRKTKKKKVCH